MTNRSTYKWYRGADFFLGVEVYLDPNDTIVGTETLVVTGKKIEHRNDDMPPSSVTADFTLTGSFVAESGSVNAYWACRGIPTALDDLDDGYYAVASWLTLSTGVVIRTDIVTVEVVT